MSLYIHSVMIPYITAVSNSVLPIATNSQSAGQRLPDVSGVAGNSGVAGVSGASGKFGFFSHCTEYLYIIIYLSAMTFLRAM